MVKLDLFSDISQELITQIRFFFLFQFLESVQQAAMESFLSEKPPRYIPPDPQVQAGRLQKQTDFLR